MIFLYLMMALTNAYSYIFIVLLTFDNVYLHSPGLEME
jgi:hypothetical protein